ncbi:MAG: UPF0182 family protein [Syntrophomonadaceae bacterium]|nr:UPF0182 family protein [Syntrophomonadaceae bacterium]
MKKTKKGLIALIVTLVVLFGIAATFFGYITDFLWFRELGYTSVFFKQLFTQMKLGIPTFAVITLLSFLYLMGLKRGYYKRIETVDTVAVKEGTLNRMALLISAVFGVLVTLSTVTGLWFEILKFMESTDFGIKDPIFNMDVSFYIFKLEFLTQINHILIGIIVAFAIVTLLFYLILLSMRRPQVFEYKADSTEYRETPHANSTMGDGFKAFGDAVNDAFGGKFKMPSGGPGFGGGGAKKQLDKDNLSQLLGIASKQIQVLGVIFFLMVAVNFWLKQYSLMYTQSGVLYGASYTDINVTLWVYRALIGLAIIGAVTFVVAFQKRGIKLGLAIPVLMIVVSIAGSGAATAVQSLIVSPDEISKESVYLENNIKFTQYAYDLQDIKTKELAATNTLTKQDILNNMDTISNIRINDFEPAEKFYNQAQSIRTYYLFNDVDVDRYMINGEYSQTFLSAREIDETKIEAQPWLSKHLKYTHGYGITLSRVDKVTESGQPDLLIESIPPISDVEEITVERPEIYFGEQTKNYIITNTDEKEFDYPSGDKNVYATYEGDAGIHLNLFNRALFALREQSLKILVSNNISSDSKIIINRNIKDRVEKIAPFLSYDADPYIVTVEGKLYWMMDAYTYSTYYPYSEPFSKDSNVNYIRNSVKVVIDAYNGDTSFYLVDDSDPIANTLAKIYPKLIKPFEQMPEALKAHIRYPNMLFQIQAGIYTKYHMNDVEVFYQSEDRWEISQEIYGMEQQAMTPNYYIMKLPGESEVEFINSIPYTPSGKKNMMALLVARNDGANYGDLILYQLPKSKIVYGPLQIEGFIDQDTNISKEFSLWSSAGSSYTRGNMFVIPIEDSLVYVEPIYLEATNSSLPEVKRVVIYYNDKIAYEPTLAQALDTMFGDGSGKPLDSGEGSSEDTEGQPEEIQTTDALIRNAVAAYNNAVTAQKEGDWAAYGKYLEQLDSYLTQLQVGNDAANTVAENEAAAEAEAAAE